MMVIMGNRLANTNDLLIEKMNEYNARIAELTPYSGDSDAVNSTTV
jgi:hypothetical protein